MGKVKREDISPPGYAPPDPRDNGKIVRPVEPDQSDLDSAGRDYQNALEIAKALAKEGSILECVDAIRALDDAPHRNDHYRPSPFVLARIRDNSELREVLQRRAKDSPILASIYKAATSKEAI